jgi:hypothetical protein
MANPLNTTRFVARDGLKGAALWAGWFSVEVPCCAPCARRLHAARLGRSLLTVVIAAAALAFGIVVVLPILPGWATGLVVLALCIVGFFVQSAWSILLPSPFSVDPHDRYVDYESRDPALVEEFATINWCLPDHLVAPSIIGACNDLVPA